MNFLGSGGIYVLLLVVAVIGVILVVFAKKLD